MVAYIDSSVLLRIALRQPQALREWRAIEKGVASALIVTECLRSLDRFRLRAQLTAAEVALGRGTLLSLMDALEIVELDSTVLDRAAQPMPVELGTLDAIHLATALLWKQSTSAELVMATHDVALGLAAQAHGLPVVGVPRS